MATIPESHVDLLDGTAVAVFGTVNPDGTPQLTPVWVDRDGDDVLVNSTTNRRKIRNVEERPVAAVCVMDPENPYRYVSVWGDVVEVTTEGALEHIHELSQKYMGEDYDRSGESGDRVRVRLRPQTVSTQ